MTLSIMKTKIDDALNVRFINKVNLDLVEPDKLSVGQRDAYLA